MAIVIRRPRAEELQTAEELVARSINNLTERHGFGAIAAARPADFQLFCLADDPEGLWVAEADGEIVGFALSWVCGDLWFLAELFVAPGRQGRGIGDALLVRALDHASKSGAGTRSLITFTFNAVSQRLYIRHGLFPRLPLYLFSAASDALVGRAPAGTLGATPIEPSASHLDRLAHLDASVLGISREKHHRYLLADGTTTGVLLHEGDECIGYAYVSTTGHVGPLAVARSQVMGAAFETALSLAAATGAARVSAFLPGSSDQALGVAVEKGMRIALPMVVASSRDFGDWTRYLPRNPGFM